MARLRYLKPTSIRAFLSKKNNTIFNYSTTTATNAVLVNPLYFSDSPAPRKLQAEDAVVVTFREWFKSSRNPFIIDRILKILSSDGSDGTGSRVVGENEDSRKSVDVALSRLNLHLTESLVLDVLSYGKDVLSCLKFFDWAGRQPGFHHTRATFNAIFKILSRAKLMSLMLEYLDNYSKHRGGHKTNFHAILVMGYAVAGKPEIALRLFGRMRYQGIDLDDFSYHVLLNALVEEDDFDGVESVAKQIKIQGFESEVTYSILVKAFCRKKEFDRAEKYLRGLMMDGGVKIKNGGGGHMVGALVDGLCKNDEFDKAGKWVDEFGEFYVYDIWIRELLRARKLDGAMEFMNKTKNQELVLHYVPNVFRYNTLILRLLRENRLEEVCDLVIEMRENNIPPDELTMNILLCFFCKAGMVDVALKLYDSRGELGLSPNGMAFNYLMNALCRDGSVVDAYRIFKNLIKQGFNPGKTTFSILAHALCKLEKLDMMNELFLVAMEKNVVLTDSVHENYIMALCRTGRLEDGYFIHGELNKLHKVTTRRAYDDMINGFIKSKRGDIAARLLVEMQEKGHTPTRKIFSLVIQSVCEMENPETQFQKLLEMQLSLHELDCGVFNVFIEGAGRAKKPDLAREVYEMMKRSGISPNVSSDILMLRSYLRSEKVSDALNFFHDILKRRKVGRKVCNAIIVGLCRANKPETALTVFSEIREKEKTVRPSLECYEELILALCRNKRYDKVMDLIDDLTIVGRPLSTFIGNNLLLHSMKHRNLYNTWVLDMDLRSSPDEMTSHISRLRELVDLFSNHYRDDVLDPNDMEKVVGNCFPLDIYTYNMLLRKLSMKQLDDAYLLFQRMCQNGYEPNQWSYEALVHGLCRHGRKTDAKMWVEEMLRRGFVPSEGTKVLL